MSLLAVEGIYRDGKVELSEIPEEVTETRVMVIFLPPEETMRTATPSADADAARRAAGERLLARMRRGYHLGGAKPYEKREELYDRTHRR